LYLHKHNWQETLALAKRPLTTPAGQPSVPDLLFSPRAAFIWNDAQKTVAWMNPAARASFELCVEDFAAALPKDIVRQLSRLTDEGGGTLRLKLKFSRRPPLVCAAELLHLADGQKGLIVAETDGDWVPASAPVAPRPQRTLPRRKMGKKGAPLPAPVPLTDEEMSAFRALGRKMKRLCAEKRKRPAPITPPALPSIRPETIASPPPAENILQIFDLILLLDRDLDVVGVEGRAAIFGWKKAQLLGKPVLDLVADAERKIVRGMAKRLSAPRGRAAKETLLVAKGAGEPLACRAALCHWDGERAVYALFLISLELPQRLKRSRAQTLAPQTSRLAA